MSGSAYRGASVLVDTNAIIEAHRVGAWRALMAAYRVETVQDCVAETQAGFQLRRPPRSIAVGELRASLAGEHAVNDSDRAALAVRIERIALDAGEESLWAHALGRNDDWLLCGPDRASIRCGVRLGFRERIVFLEALLGDVGHRPRIALRRHYIGKWLEKVLAGIILAETDHGAPHYGFDP